MHETHISFYLSGGRLHVFPEALRGIGNPTFVRFLLSNDGLSMIMEPYNRKVFASFRVPKGLYEKTDKWTRMEFKCAPFCRMMAHHLSWDMGQSYRVKGKIYPAQRIVKFDLQSAYPINSESVEV